MRIKPSVLQDYLRRNQLTDTELARLMGVCIAELTKILEGKPVGTDIIRKLIRYFGAAEARCFVNWKKQLNDGETVEALFDEDDRFSDGLCTGG